MFLKERRIMVVGCALITAFLFALPLFIYNTLAFGAPWRLGYQSVVGFSGMKQGILGIGMPQVEVLYEIIFGSYRGILQICPLLLLVPIGLVQMGMRGEERGLALLIGFLVVYYLLLNSSYYYWDGGWSTGPRHITGMLPFACLPLGSVWNSSSKHMRAFVLLLVLASLALALMSCTAGMFASTEYKHLLGEFVIPRFFHGSTTAVPVYLFNWSSRYFLLSFLSFWMCLALVIAHQLRSPQCVAVQVKSRGRSHSGTKAS
jgi:hypothetical protein